MWPAAGIGTGYSLENGGHGSSQQGRDELKLGRWAHRLVRPSVLGQVERDLSCTYLLRPPQGAPHPPFLLLHPLTTWTTLALTNKPGPMGQELTSEQGPQWQEGRQAHLILSDISATSDTLIHTPSPEHSLCSAWQRSPASHTSCLSLKPRVC